MLADGIGHALDLATWAYFTHRIDEGYQITSPEQIASAVSAGAELALGLWLVFGCRGIIGVIHLIRYGRNSAQVSTSGRWPTCLGNSPG